MPSLTVSHRIFPLAAAIAIGAAAFAPWLIAEELSIIDDLQTDECTGYLITGLAGGNQSFFAKNRDSTSWREAAALVTPAEGFKYLVIHTDSHLKKNGYGGAAVSGLNEKGVGGATFAGFTNEKRAAKPWDPSQACREALQFAATPKDYVEKFGAIVKEHGMPSGGSSAAVSAKEGWKIEYAVHQWAIEGPYIDDFSPIANVYSITSMKRYEASDWTRFGRLRKAREILERGLYPSGRGQPWPRTWDLTKAFAFSRSTEACECPITGVPDAFAEGALPGTVAGSGSDPRPICDSLPGGRAGRCVSAHIVLPDARHPDYLSVLWWSLDRPTNAPFIPLFIGITQLPKAIDAQVGFEASDAFNQFRHLLYEHPEYKALSEQTWTSFETRQQRLITEELLSSVRAKLSAGEPAAASAILNQFLQAQVDEAMRLVTLLNTKITQETVSRLQPATTPKAPSR